MQIIDHEPQLWFLLQDGKDYFLDIFCNHSFISYSVLIQLTADEKQQYKNDGHAYISMLAEAVNYSAPIAKESKSSYKNRDSSKTPLAKKTHTAIMAWNATNDP